VALSCGLPKLVPKTMELVCSRRFAAQEY